MLEYYSLSADAARSYPKRHTGQGNLSRLVGYAPGCWLNIASPTEEEIIRAAAELGVPKDFITDSLDPAERPHALAEGRARLIICKVSSPNPDPDSIPFMTIPLGIIITPEAVATVCRHEALADHLALAAGYCEPGRVDSENPAQTAFGGTPGGTQAAPGESAAFTNSVDASSPPTGSLAAAVVGNDVPAATPAAVPAALQPQIASAQSVVTGVQVGGVQLAGTMADGIGDRRGILFALSLLQQSSIRFTAHLQQLDALTETLEPRMRGSMRNQDLVRMMQIEKTLVYFAMSLKGNNGVLDKIASNQLFSLDGRESALLTDSVIECRQAADMAEVYIQILSSMSNTSASMISNDMNSAMKFLAAITLILTVPMIVAGLYGMNVALPFADSPLAIWGIIAGIVAVCWVLWGYLSKKHWM